MYCSAGMGIIAAQELWLSIDTTRNTFSGIPFWLLNACYGPFCSAPSQIAAWSLAVKFHLPLRATCYRRCLKLRVQAQIIIAALLLSFAVYGGLLVAFPHYLARDANRWAAANREWWLFLGYTLVSLAANYRVKQIIQRCDDVFSVASELRFGVSLFLITVVYYVLSAAAQFTLDRETWESNVLPIDYIMYIFFALYYHNLVSQPRINYRGWRRGNFGRISTRHSYSNDGESKRWPRGTSDEVNITCEDWRLDISEDALGAPANQLTSSIATSTSQTPADSASGGTPRILQLDVGKGHLNKGRRRVVPAPSGTRQWSLTRVLQDEHMIEVLSTHAARSFCGELMHFWRTMRSFWTEVREGRQLISAESDALVPNNDTINVLQPRFSIITHSPNGFEPDINTVQPQSNAAQHHDAHSIVASELSAKQPDDDTDFAVAGAMPFFFERVIVFARQIYDCYLAKDSQFELNVGHVLRRRFYDALIDTECSISERAQLLLGCMRAVQKEVLALIRTTSGRHVK